MSSDTRALFIGLLIAHAAHIGEEAWGRFWLIDAVFGMPVFLVGNALLLAGAGLVFVMAARRKGRWTGIAIAYATFMALQGVGHNAAFLITGRYFGGFAGGVTGVALLAFGAPLAFQLISSARASARSTSLAGTSVGRAGPGR